MKKIILVLVLLLCICTAGCLSNQADTSFIAHQWTQDELNQYWDGCNTLFDLQTKLAADKYQYGNEENDISYATDTPTPILVTMSRGYSNCTGWTYYFTEFVKYKTTKGIYICESYNVVLLRNDLNWHYIAIFKDQGIYTEQSNLSLGISYNEQEIYDGWYNKGWKYQKVSERWVK